MIIFCIYQPALAKVVELDNQNIAHCQEQLKNEDWVDNIVMLYVKDSPGTNKFRAIFEQVSIEHPKRHLFALNVFDPKADMKKNQVILSTINACLTDMMYRGVDYMGVINDKTPAVLLYDYSHAKVGLGNHEISTKEDMLKFMGVRFQKTPN